MANLHAREYAKLAKRSVSGIRQWSIILDDWNYGDEYESRERIGFMSADSSGNIYCITAANYRSGETSYNYRRVIKISSSRIRLWTVSIELTGAVPSNVLIVAAATGFSVSVFEEGQIVALSASGDQLWQNSSFAAITGLKIGDDGFIYVTDSSGVHKLDVTGTVLWTTAIGNGE